MATGHFTWNAWDGVPLDGSTGNAGPGQGVAVGTDANPKKRLLVYDFDAATDEHLQFDDVMPGVYAGGALSVDIFWFANATTATQVRWGAKIGAVTPADADTPIEHATAAASTAGSSTITAEANRLQKLNMALSNLDGLAADDPFWLLVYRDADGTSGTDDLAVDARLWKVRLNFTY